MPNIRPIATDDDGARILGAMIQGARDTESGALPVTQHGNVGAVVVEIREDIDADDYDQHDAVLMKLDGADFVDTPQTVMVRNISRQGISASDDSPVRMIARPVSNLGLCIEAPSTGGHASILFKILRVLRGVGLNCNAMECEVLNVSCGGESLVSIGDIETVYDEMGCVFNAAEILLVGRKGYAKQMSNPSYRIQDPLVFEPGTEDIATPTGRCRWAADRLCCVEEDTTV